MSEVTKVAQPANLVGRKYSGFWGLTENILSNSRIIVAILIFASKRYFSFPRNFLSNILILSEFFYLSVNVFWKISQFHCNKISAKIAVLIFIYKWYFIVPRNSLSNILIVWKISRFHCYKFCATIAHRKNLVKFTGWDFDICVLRFFQLSKKSVKYLDSFKILPCF